MNDTPIILDYCPFCGSTNLKIDSKRKSVSFKGCHCSVSVRCMKCHARGPTVSIKMPYGQYDERTICAEAAKAEWNTRYQEIEKDSNTKPFFAII